MRSNSFDENSAELSETGATWRSGQPRYRHLISPGISEPLAAVMFHSEAPIDRRRMCGQGLHPQADFHIAVHEIRGLPYSLDRRYCEPHSHNCPEINLLISFERLVFRISLGDESYFCEAPSSIYIPAGVPHSANVIEGTGFFVALIGSSDYRRSLTGDLDGSSIVDGSLKVMQEAA